MVVEPARINAWRRPRHVAGEHDDMNSPLSEVFVGQTKLEKWPG